MGDSQRWAITLILAVPSALLIVCNWGGLVSASRAGRGYSFAPPWLCGVAGAMACVVCPAPGIWRFAWVPLVLDPSIVLLVARLGGWRSPFDRRPGSPEDKRHAEPGAAPDRGRKAGPGR